MHSAMIVATMPAMSAKFIFNGVEITVAVAELGDAMKALGLMPRQAPVAVQSAPALLPVSQADASPPVGLVTTQPAARYRRGSLIASATPMDEQRYALKLLKAVQDGGRTGALSRTVMAALGTASPKGLGSITVMANKALSDCGFEPADVYTKARGPLGRTWVAGPRLKDATAALERFA